MIIEDELTPYNQNGTYKDIKFYTLPIPKDVLLSKENGKEDIEMRVTLSYFIEPNPSSRGRSKYSYESHGLRFAAALATSNILAVWPTGGWWKTSKDRTNEKARFSLIVTIKTKADIDLLTPIQTMVKQMSTVPGSKTVIPLEKA